MAYPASEVRAAARAARADGVPVPTGDEGHDVVRVLERRGYLPRDRARVDALVERITRDATVRVEVRRRVERQLEFPLWGRWVDEDVAPLEPVQLAFAV